VTPRGAEPPRRRECDGRRASPAAARESGGFARIRPGGARVRRVRANPAAAREPGGGARVRRRRVNPSPPRHPAWRRGGKTSPTVTYDGGGDAEPPYRWHIATSRLPAGYGASIRYPHGGTVSPTRILCTAASICHRAATACPVDRRPRAAPFCRRVSCRSATTSRAVLPPRAAPVSHRDPRRQLLRPSGSEVI
jgi:hypothetical protein